MTLVVIRRRGGKIVGFEADSHAGYADAGSDIVCSGISALVQSAVLGLAQVAQVEPTYSVGDAMVACALPEGLTQQARERADMILETMLLGLAAIAEQYADNLDITQREV